MTMIFNQLQCKMAEEEKNKLLQKPTKQQKLMVFEHVSLLFQYSIENGTQVGISKTPL